MEGDWAELDDAGDLGVGQLHIPDVELPELPQPVTPSPKENAWTRPNQSHDVRRPSGDVRKTMNLFPAAANTTANTPRRSDFPPPSNRGGHFSNHGSASYTNKTRGQFATDGAVPPASANSAAGTAPAPPAATGTAHFSSHSDRYRGSAPDSRWSASSETSSIFVTNLPYETKEQDVVAFFADFHISEADVSLLRRNEKGQVHAATVKFPTLDSAKEALRLDGNILGGRPAYIRLESSDRRHTGGGGGGGGGFRSSGFTTNDHGQRYVNSPPGYGDNSSRGHRDWKNHGSTSGFGGSFARDAHTDGVPVHVRDRKGYGNSSGHFEPAPFHGHGGGGSNRDREDGGKRERRGPLSHGSDLSIPQGPTPEGRKKLQLLPRTKPPPKLEIDIRAIDLPARPPSVTSSVASAASSEVKTSDDLDRNIGAVHREKAISSSHATHLSNASGYSQLVTPSLSKSDKPSTSPISAGSARELHAAGVNNDVEREKPKSQNSFAALDVDEADDDEL